MGISRGSFTATVSMVVFAAFALAPVRADFTVGGTTFDESILSDDFNGATLDTQWDSHVSNNGTVAMNETDSVLIQTGSSGSGSARFRRSTAYINLETDGGLNYGASPTDWAVEIKFQMQNENNGFEWESPVGTGYQWSILGGYDTTDANGWATVQGFDLRAVRNGLKWSLGWYGGDYAPPEAPVFVDRPSTIDLVPEPSLQEFWLHNDETYTIGLHRKPDGNVDVYFTGNVYNGTTDAFEATYDNQLIATKPLILDLNPGGLVAGDWTQVGIGGKMSIDSLKIGKQPGQGVPGDYNGNGVVDAADYVLWRKGVAPLDNEIDVTSGVGVTDDGDYTAWRGVFGNPPGSGSSLGDSPVPEPAAVALLVLGTFAWFGAVGARCRDRTFKNGSSSACTKY